LGLVLCLPYSLTREWLHFELNRFPLVYFESTQDLDMTDVDITDILLAIARQVSESLDKIGIKLKPGYFRDRFQEIADFLQTPIELSLEAGFSLPGNLAKITAKTKESPQLRSHLRQYLEPRTSGILDSLNQEILARAFPEVTVWRESSFVRNPPIVETRHGASLQRL